MPITFYSLVKGECSLEEYFIRLRISPHDDSQTSPYQTALCRIWTELKNIPLYGMYLPAGVFYHLGTSIEFLNLVTAPIHSPDPRNPNHFSISQQKKFSSLCEKYNLQHHIHSKLFNSSRINSFLTDSVAKSIGSQTEMLDWKQLDVISINSCLCFSATSSIGKQSLFESSIIFGDCSIGDQCIVSHLTASLGSSLVLPSRTMVQQIPISFGDCCEFVVLVLGLGDDIKATADSDGLLISSPTSDHLS
jgi:hypothetical protein